MTHNTRSWLLPHTLEAEAGGLLWVWSQPVLIAGALLKTNKQTTNKKGFFLGSKINKKKEHITEEKHFFVCFSS